MNNIPKKQALSLCDATVTSEMVFNGISVKDSERCPELLLPIVARYREVGELLTPVEGLRAEGHASSFHLAGRYSVACVIPTPA